MTTGLDSLCTTAGVGFCPLEGKGLLAGAEGECSGAFSAVSGTGLDSGKLESISFFGISIVSDVPASCAWAEILMGGGGGILVGGAKILLEETRLVSDSDILTTFERFISCPEGWRGGGGGSLCGGESFSSVMLTSEVGGVFS